jgi:hypothetical protein
LIKSYKETAQNNEKSVIKIVNKFYSPSLFKLIQDELPLMPLWSGITVNTVFDLMPDATVKKVPDINKVENWFGHLKHNILRGRKNLMPSEFTSIMYDRLKYYYNFYFDVD